MAWCLIKYRDNDTFTMYGIHGVISQKMEVFSVLFVGAP
jgi:hypothetical protein